MEKKTNVILFLLWIFGFSLVFVFNAKQKISVAEKRKLAEFPEFSTDSYLSGIWTKKIDDYIDDHFPLRPSFIAYSDYFHLAKGFQLKNSERVVVVPKNKKRVDDKAKDSIQNKKMFLDEFDERYSGAMLIIDGCVYPMGGGSPAMSKHFADMVNEYAKNFKNLRVFSAVAPLSSAFIPVEKYQNYNAQNKKTLLAIKSNLSGGAIFCDVFKELDDHSNKKLYFGSDHHWKPLGAYYGYVAFCKAAGFDPVPLEKMTKKVKYNFLGSLYQHTKDPTVKEHPDTMEYWIPKVSTEAERFGATGTEKSTSSKVFYESSSGGNTYSTFLGGDHPLIRIRTGVKNGRKAVVIKNSMGNAFSVFLVSHYQEIWVVDFRYSKQNLSKIIKENGINDLIFAVGMYAAMSKGTIGMMRRLATQSGANVPEENHRESNDDPVNPIEKDSSSRE